MGKEQSRGKKRPSTGGEKEKLSRLAPEDWVLEGKGRRRFTTIRRRFSHKKKERERQGDALRTGRKGTATSSQTREGENARRGGG